MAENSRDSSVFDAQYCLDLINAIVIVLNKNGNIRFINKKGADILGYDCLELIDKNWFKTCIPKNQEKQIRQIFSEIISGNIKPFENHENPVLTKTGKEKIIGWNNYYIEYQEKKIESILSIGFEVTKEEEIKKQLKQDEERLREIIKNTSDWIWEVDKNGKYTYATGQIENILGYTLKEIIGKTPFDLMLKEEAEKISKIFKEIIKKKGPIKDLENWNIAKNGKRICFLTNGAPILNERKEVVGYRGINKDITERKNTEEKLKESEEKYRSIVENAEDLIFVLDKNNKFISANPKVAILLKTTPDKLIGKSIPDLFPKETSLQFSKNTQEVFATAKSKLIEEKMIVGNNEFYNSTILNPIKNNKGEVTVVMGIVRDITKQKQAEKEIKERAQELEKFNSLTINRELKMIELKKEINALLEKAGEKPKYTTE